MSAQLVNSIACRTYSVLFLVAGFFFVAAGGVLVYWALQGIPPSIEAAIATRGVLAEAGKILPVLGPAFIVVGLIPTALGVFAWLRHLWALIVGTVLWVLLMSKSLMAWSGGLGSHKFEVISILVLVLLTIVAAIARRRPGPAALQA